MKNTMKKVFLLMALALIVAGGAFAQRVGDTWQVGNETWVVQSVNDDTLTMKKAQGLGGVWQAPAGDQYIFNGIDLVWTNMDRLPALWQDAKDKGFIKVGDQVFRNLRKTGDLTWTGEKIDVTGSGRNATGTRWVNTTITLSADGTNFRASGSTFTRIQ